jgi:hypothetical protein
MVHPPPPAPAAPTAPPTTTHRRSPPRRRCAHQEAASTLKYSAGGGGCSAAHMHRWPGLPAEPSTLVRYHPILPAGALAPRRCRSRLPRSRLHLQSRRTTVAGAPQTPLPPLKKVFPRSKCDGLLLLRRARRGRLSPRSTRGACVQSREQAWAPIASSPGPASTRRALTHPRKHARRTRAPEGRSDIHRTPLARPCSPSSADTPRRRLCARRRGPTPRWEGR